MPITYEREIEDLLKEAIILGKELGYLSASIIQRKLRLGYAKSAMILDILEEKGMLEPYNGSKPRKFHA
jgi:S-DNA-T family DNA segregation ATPase FtsK/SpoIIIE